MLPSNAQMAARRDSGSLWRQALSCLTENAELASCVSLPAIDPVGLPDSPGDEVAANIPEHRMKPRSRTIGRQNRRCRFSTNPQVVTVVPRDRPAPANGCHSAGGSIRDRFGCRDAACNAESLSETSSLPPISAHRFPGFRGIPSRRPKSLRNYRHAPRPTTTIVRR
jgi:hypothetical protein